MSGVSNEWRDSCVAFCDEGGIDDRGMYNKVTNCIIHDIDCMGTKAAGIASGGGSYGGQYIGNTIREGGGNGITIYLASSLRVEHNHIYDVGSLTIEAGLIWSGWTHGGGTVIAYNRVHDNLDARDGDGISLDKQTQDYRIHHNLVWNVKSTGIKLNSPALNSEVYNNTILSSCTEAFWCCCGPYENLNQRGCKFINNIANAPMFFAKGAGAPEQHHNGYYAVDANGWPTPTSRAIDAGVVIPGITDGYVGAAPDIGCFEVGTEPWRAGADWEETDFTRVPNTEGFETGDLIEFDWRSDGDTPWLVTSQEKHSGFYSAESGPLSDGETTTLRVTLDCRRGEVAFWRKVFSEQGWNCLMFSINGNERARWSGKQNWAQVSFPVSGGRTTFEWRYSKDSSGSSGQDAAWIDDIEFPIK
jgi:hypothetical protein